MLGLFNFRFANVIADGNGELFLKKPGEIAGRERGMFGKIFHRDSAIDMAVYIVHAEDNRF